MIIDNILREIIIEQVLVSDFVDVEERDSLIIPDLKYTVEKFHCPNCKRVLPMPEHGAGYVCGCGLNMRSYGNALYISFRAIPEDCY